MRFLIVGPCGAGFKFFNQPQLRLACTCLTISVFSLKVNQQFELMNRLVVSLFQGTIFSPVYHGDWILEAASAWMQEDRVGDEKWIERLVRFRPDYRLKNPRLAPTRLTSFPLIPFLQRPSRVRRLCFEGGHCSPPLYCYADDTSTGTSTAPLLV